MRPWLRVLLAILISPWICAPVAFAFDRTSAWLLAPVVVGYGGVLLLGAPLAFLLAGYGYARGWLLIGFGAFLPAVPLLAAKAIDLISPAEFQLPQTGAVEATVMLMVCGGATATVFWLIAEPALKARAAGCVEHLSLLHTDGPQR